MPGNVATFSESRWISMYSTLTFIQIMYIHTYMYTLCVMYMWASGFICMYFLTAGKAS